MDFIILFGLLAVVFNVLDSVSTKLCFSLPKDVEGKEGNPLMAKLMENDYFIAEMVKHVGVTLLVLWWMYSRDITLLIMASMVLGIVVLNNFYIYVTRKILKKKIPTMFTPFAFIVKKLKIPGWLEYILLIIILVNIARWLASVIGGIL